MLRSKTRGVPHVRERRPRPQPPLNTNLLHTLRRPFRVIHDPVEQQKVQPSPPCPEGGAKSENWHLPRWALCGPMVAPARDSSCQAGASNHALGAWRLNGPSSNRCCRTSCAAFRVSMTSAHSTASFGCRVQVRRGALSECRSAAGHSSTDLSNAIAVAAARRAAAILGRAPG